MTEGDASANNEPEAGRPPPARRSKARSGLDSAGQLVNEPLPCLICLLDARACIVHVNRAVERWGLGASGGLTGCSFHELLHPGCVAASCQLEQMIADCSSSASRAQECEAWLRAEALQRCLDVTVWGLPPRAQIDEPATAVAIVVVSDVSVPENAREYLSELEREAGGAERKEIYAALYRSRDEFAEFARELIEADELQRQQLAEQLQSDILQALAAAKYDLERGQALVRTSRQDDLPTVLQRATTVLQDAIDDMRSLATSLRPSVLDDLGPLAAIQGYCREFSQENPAIEVGQQISVLALDIPQRLSTPVFRCVQELLDGIRKDGSAHRVVVLLSRGSEHLVLEILNDGVVISGPQEEGRVRKESGVFAARLRAQITGGRLSVLPGGAGFCTRVRVEWPLRAEEVNQ